VQVIPRCEATNYIKDLDKVDKRFGHIFKHGGFIAGGSLRRAIANRTFFKVFDKDMFYILLEQYKEDNKNRYFHQTLNCPDVDVYFRNKHQMRDLIKKHYKEESWREYEIREKAALGKMKKTSKDSLDYAYKKYSLNSYFIHQKRTNKLQLIPWWVIFGSPAKVISKFDIENCKFAYDGKNLYFTEKAMQNERVGHLEYSLDGTFHDSLSIFLNRIHKYLSFADSNCEHKYKTVSGVVPVMFDLMCKTKNPYFNPTISRLLNDKRLFSERREMKKSIGPFIGKWEDLFSYIKPPNETNLICLVDEQGMGRIAKMVKENNKTLKSPWAIW